MQCDRSTSLDAFFNMVQSVPPYPLAILGMGCAVATEPVAELNNNWRLPMVFCYEIYYYAVGGSRVDFMARVNRVVMTMQKLYSRVQHNCA